MIVEVNRAPEKQQGGQQDQPDRHRGVPGLQFSGARCGRDRLFRFEIHCAGAFVAGAFVSVGEAAPDIGVSNNCAFAFRLSKYATSALASGLGTISTPAGGADFFPSSNCRASRDGTWPGLNFRSSNKN